MNDELKLLLSCGSYLYLFSRGDLSIHFSISGGGAQPRFWSLLVNMKESSTQWACAPTLPMPAYTPMVQVMVKAPRAIQYPFQEESWVGFATTQPAQLLRQEFKTYLIRCSNPCFDGKNYFARTSLFVCQQRKQTKWKGEGVIGLIE